jgi:hypothetical protein
MLIFGAYCPEAAIYHRRPGRACWNSRVTSSIETPGKPSLSRESTTAAAVWILPLVGSAVNTKRPPVARGGLSFEMKPYFKKYQEPKPQPTVTIRSTAIQ